MMTSEIVSLLGRTVTIKMESVQVECVIRDGKQVYGSTRLLVEPIRGAGHQWVDRARLVTVRAQDEDGQ
jgi:hypothetical protein